MFLLKLNFKVTLQGDSFNSNLKCYYYLNLNYRHRSQEGLALLYELLRDHLLSKRQLNELAHSQSPLRRLAHVRSFSYRQYKSQFQDDVIQVHHVDEPYRSYARSGQSVVLMLRYFQQPHQSIIGFLLRTRSLDGFLYSQ